MKTTALSQIAKTSSGGTPSRDNSEYYGGKILWVKSGELKDSFISKTEETITAKGLQNSSAKLFPPETLLIALYGATVGKLGILKVEASTNQAVCAILPAPILDKRFLFYYLLSQREYLISKSAGGAQPNISQEIIQNLGIPLPSLDEQKRIAAILDKADRLRRQRRFAQTLSDSFLQSVFVKMFGDPASNPMSWNILPLRKISAKFSDGPFGSNLKTEHYTNSGIPVIRLQNIGVGEYVESHPSFISHSHFKELSKHRCIPGDIIIGTMGEPNLRACILPKSIPEALNKADCVQIRVDEKKSKSDFICWLLNMPQTLYLASGMILGQTRSRISMGRLAELYVPIPPLPLQEKFAAIVQKFERVRRQQREATRQAEHLFQTLLHRAFRGEL